MGVGGIPPAGNMAIIRAPTPIEVGVMDYGFEIDGIIGMDFFIQVGAIIDIMNFEIRTDHHKSSINFSK